MYYVSDTAVIAPTGPSAYEEECAEFEIDFPGWEQRLAESEDGRFVQPREFAPDFEPVSDEDWDAWLEMSWSDPAEG